MAAVWAYAWCCRRHVCRWTSLCARDTASADENHYVLQAPGLSVNIRTRYSYWVCKWISVFVTGTDPADEHYMYCIQPPGLQWLSAFVTGTEPADEHCMYCTTGIWSVDEYQHLLQAQSLQMYIICTVQQTPGLSLNISIRYKHRACRWTLYVLYNRHLVCRWKSLFDTDTRSAGEDGFLPHTLGFFTNIGLCYRHLFCRRKSVSNTGVLSNSSSSTVMFLVDTP